MTIEYIEKLINEFDRAVNNLAHEVSRAAKDGRNATLYLEATQTYNMVRERLIEAIKQYGKECFAESVLQNLRCQNCGKQLKLHTVVRHNINHIACKVCDHVLHPSFIRYLDTSSHSGLLDEFGPKLSQHKHIGSSLDSWLEEEGFKEKDG